MASFTSVLFPKSASASSKKQNYVACRGLSEDAVQILLVSSMYLLTTEDRSTLTISSLRALAMISAAIVLPVPEAPEKRIFSPLPRASFSSNPHLK